MNNRTGRHRRESGFMPSQDHRLPLVYSCSGCSSAAQMANAVAIRLDRANHAEMSCIAGVGGDVPSLVRLAQSGRPIVAIDGCPLHCVRSCLARHGVTPSMHLTLTELGIRKKYHMEFNETEATAVFESVVANLQAEAVGTQARDSKSTVAP
jgi:uncharacterized metal-binding protein